MKIISRFFYIIMSAFIFSTYFCLFCILCFSTRIRSERVSYYCPRAAPTYSPNSTYRSNLNQVFLTLSSNAAREDGFYNYTVGRGPPDTVYGLFLCRGDVNINVCQQCVEAATTEVLQICPDRKRATIWYDFCMLRFSNEFIFSTLEQSVNVSLTNTQNVTDEPNRFRQLLGETVNEIVLEAANSNIPGNGGISKKVIIAIVVPIAVSLVLLFIGCFFLTRRTRKKRPYDAVNEENDEGNEISLVESLQYELNTIVLATNNFSADNKIGEGGFGSVYKGTFANGQEIAVKRLSQSSRQGVKEFKNEVVLVAKLRHKNLVGLLGFCLEGEEKILIYEFVPNKSLDYFLFDPEKRQMLDWSKCYKIIVGIARGLVYLHEDSRLRIIHRDVKASNILLDGDMNPKISDFGIARIFGIDQSQGNTNRIVGTYGYMSPEYAMHGQFSVKSDVFSFGVLVLEIISGKKNSSFYESDGSEDLISYAWKLWRDNRPLELMDLTLQNAYSRNEIIRCIHIGLLCVQEDPDERPNMGSILLALNSYSATLDAPRQPAFFLRSRTRNLPRVQDSDKSTSSSTPFSINEASITELYPR